MARVEIFVRPCRARGWGAHMLCMVSLSAMDGLGRALRDGTMTQTDFDLLAELRSAWRDERSWWEESLRRVCTRADVTVTGRVKNLGTLREKLHRMNGGLSTIRDVVGVRVVAHGGRFEQLWTFVDVGEVARNHSMKFIDRISDPRFGYRALHLEVRRNGVRAEVQIRSQLQHEWAEAMERFADKAGRDVRYVENYDFPLLSGATRQMALKCREYLSMWSSEINSFERNGSPDFWRSYLDYLAQETKSLLEEFDERIL